MWEKLNKFYIKTYGAGMEHIPKNVSRFREYTILEKYYNSKIFCELSVTKEKLSWNHDPEIKDTLYSYISISWNNLEQTKLNIVIKNIDNGTFEVDIVDSDGNLIENNV